MNTIINGVVALDLIKFEKFETNIPAANIPTGPLVNISGVQGGDNTPYTITVLAYLPDNTLSRLKNTSGLQLQGNEIYLNYYGINPVSILNKDGGTDIVQGREFRVEFNCKEEADNFDLYYVQFTYQINDGSSADVILLRDEDEDPETDRGTITTPVKITAPTL